MQKPLVRIVAAILAVLLVVGVGVAAIAPMAGAHGDDGVLAVVSPACLTIWTGSADRAASRPGGVPTRTAVTATTARPTTTSAR